MGTRDTWISLGAGCLLAIGAHAPAAAQGDVFSLDAIDADADIRLSAADGERSWLEGDFGKLRWGGDASGGEALRLSLASADFAWKPQFSFDFAGLVSVSYQDGADPKVGLNEAFLTWRSKPAPTRLTIKAGVFWPPVSQEHGGSNWLVTESVTPSAVNSWIGEEVKVLGLEGKLDRDLGEHHVALTGAVFKHNDIAGTFLAYRGWALHDLRVTTAGYFPLPPLSAMIAPYQALENTPFWELDGRVGYYARADWCPPLPVTVNLLRYDNRGDRVSARAMQTAWRTRFWNAGAMVTLGDSTTARAQVLWGNTLVGPDTPFGIPVDVDFSAGYLLLTRQLGTGAVSLRGDLFGAHDNSFVAADDNDEQGWSAMLAYRRPVTDFAQVLVELLHVDSDRPARALNAGVRAQQSQTSVQTSLRLHF